MNYALGKPNHDSFPLIRLMQGLREMRIYGPQFRPEQKSIDTVVHVTPVVEILLPVAVGLGSQDCDVMVGIY